VSVALACLLASASVVASSGAGSRVAIAGVLGVLGIVWALLAGSRTLVAPAVGLLALTALGANTSSFALVPVESAFLVAIALLAWWSLDERHDIARAPRADSGRVAATAALVGSAAGLSALVIAMASVASADLTAPAVGAVGSVSIAAALWSLARLRRYETEHRR